VRSANERASSGRQRSASEMTTRPDSIAPVVGRTDRNPERQSA
jgi:hypothetical protein